ncbi:MAG: class I SAM-dependent methyltransferase [Spirochaetales bacterium]
MENLDPADGYDRYAPYYKKDHLNLDSFDWTVAGAWWREALVALETREPLESRKAPLVLLDAGCGDGRSLSRFEKWIAGKPGTDLQGCDISREMVKLAAQKVHTATVGPLDVEDEDERTAWVAQHGRADLLSAFFLLVHIDREADFFEAMTQLLAPKGILLMNTIPQRKPPVLVAGTKKFTILSHHHNLDAVREAGYDAGLDLIREHTIEEDFQVVSTVFWWQSRAQAAR